MFRENPDFIGVFCCPNAGFSRCIFEDVKPLFSLWVQYRTPVQLNIRRRRTSQNLSAVLHFPSPKFCKRLRAFSISRKRSDQNVLHQHTSPQQYGGHHEATTRWKSAGRRQAPWGVSIQQSGLRLQALSLPQKKERLLHGNLPGTGCQTHLRRSLFL